MSIHFHKVKGFSLVGNQFYLIIKLLTINETLLFLVDILQSNNESLHVDISDIQTWTIKSSGVGNLGYPNEYQPVSKRSSSNA